MKALQQLPVVVPQRFIQEAQHKIRKELRHQGRRSSAAGSPHRNQACIDDNIGQSAGQIDFPEESLLSLRKNPDVSYRAHIREGNVPNKNP